jgi:hypothetical protein
MKWSVIVERVDMDKWILNQTFAGMNAEVFSLIFFP